ncbi:uncharacterized protein LOC132259823 [Phlebotomus argentipes]|uniref:uncharacterized protein LOC132259823 n=1 Tax=Phlebotomus argentipes TaxID=94469 RepID=UPI002892D3F0|nr:uncharacterized protein LOC132259823 [Phlebotomus argentipes]
MASLLESTKTIVKSLLVSVGGTTTVELLEKDYMNMEEERLPYGMLGFSTAEAFVRSLNDLVRVNGHGRSAVVELLVTKNSKSLHIQQMVKAQKKDKKFNEKFQRSARQHNSGNWQRSRYSTNQRNQTQTTYPPAPLFNQYTAVQYQYPIPLSMIPLQALQSVLTRNVFRDNFPEYSPTFPCNASHPLFSNAPQPTQHPPQYSQRLIETSIRREPERTKTPSPIRTPPRTPSPIERPQTPPKTVPQLASPAQESPEPVEFEDEWEIPDVTSIRPPPGYTESCFGSKSSIGSTEDFFSKVTDNIAKLERLSITEDSVHTHLDSISLESLTLEASGNIADPALPDWVYETMEIVPDGMASYKDELKINERTDILTIGKWSEIYVTEVHNPHKFFFQTEKEQAELNAVMDDLKSFYSRSSNDSLEPKFHELRPKLPVAGLFENVWHRGVTLSEPFQLQKQNMCKIYYVDYGTVDNVPLAGIRFLHKRFLDQPQLCHRASMSGILPLGESWDVKVTRFLLAHVIGRKLYAIANSFYAPDRSWHVELVNPATTPSLNINIAMIEEEQARYYDRPDLEDYMDYYKKHPPTFDELICGQYPTYSELLEYNRLGIEYQIELRKESRATEENAENVLYLSETNPFIEMLREKNFRVIPIQRNCSSTQNCLDSYEKKAIPLDNLNIPIDKAHISTNPFMNYD